MASTVQELVMGKVRLGVAPAAEDRGAEKVSRPLVFDRKKSEVRDREKSFVAQL